MLRRSMSSWDPGRRPEASTASRGGVCIRIYGSYQTSPSSMIYEYVSIKERERERERILKYHTHTLTSPRRLGPRRRGTRRPTLHRRHVQYGRQTRPRGPTPRRGSLPHQREGPLPFPRTLHPQDPPPRHQLSRPCRPRQRYHPPKIDSSSSSSSSSSMIWAI